MSWKYQSAFVSNEPTIIKQQVKSKSDKSGKITKQYANFKTLETETLKTDVIDNNYLLMNGKDIIITSDRLHINSKKNSLCMPPNGPVNINNNMLIDDTTTTINNDLIVKNKMKTSMNMHLVKRIIKAPKIVLDKNDYDICNHYVIDVEPKITKKEIVMLPFNNYTTDCLPINYTHVYIIHLCVNGEKEDDVDIDIIIDSQDLVIKMESCYSSLSLMWLPQGKWLIHTLGYKTIPIDN
jgi:hypothetical protein